DIRRSAGLAVESDCGRHRRGNRDGRGRRKRSLGRDNDGSAYAGPQRNPPPLPLAKAALQVVGYSKALGGAVPIKSGNARRDFQKLRRTLTRGTGYHKQEQARQLLASGCAQERSC